MKLKNKIGNISKSAGGNLAKIVLITSLAIGGVVEKAKAQVINKQADGVELVEKVRRRSGAEQLQDPNQTPEQFLEENKNLKLSPERRKYINEKYYDEYESSEDESGIGRAYDLRLEEDTPLQDFFDICILSSQKNYKDDDVAFVYDNEKIRNINPLVLLRNLKKIRLDNNPNLQNVQALRLLKNQLESLSIKNSNITSLDPIRNSKTIRGFSFVNTKINPTVFKSLPADEIGICIGKETADFYKDYFIKELQLKEYINDDGDSVFNINGSL